MSEFSSSPTGAEVAMNGEVLGRTPLQIPVSAGEATFEFSAPRHIDGATSVVIEGKRKVQVSTSGSSPQLGKC